MGKVTPREILSMYLENINKDRIQTLV